MPKSRGRRKPAKKPPQSKRVAPKLSPDGTTRGRYDVGQIQSPADAIGGLLLSGLQAPDLMVELLPALLWLEHASGHPTNLCASSCVTLHYAYAALGIEAQPRAVDLMVTNQRTDERTLYGRPDPYWSGPTFHGHCILWLPGSGRFIDPTVEQYPDVRRYRLGPICGRLAATMGTADQQDSIANGELIPGTHIGVQRQDLLLLYTAVDHEYDDVVMAGPPIVANLLDAERSGRNLASQALVLLSQPEVIDRARQAPHRRVRALLDLLAGAEPVYDDADDLRFILPADPTRTPRRLDEIELPPPLSPKAGVGDLAHRLPRPRAATAEAHSGPSSPAALDVVTQDDSPSDPSTPRRRGLLARLRAR